MRHLPARDAWALIQAAAHLPVAQRPLFLDIRMEIESLYVGRPPGVEHWAWYEYPDLVPDAARFVRGVERLVQGDQRRTVVLICRSGQRTVLAGHALEAAGFADVVNVLHGFEGDLDARDHRSTVNGWRHDGLPWVQM